MQAKFNQMLRDAALTLADYARLLGVTRVTIHTWSHGRASPHKLLREKNDDLMLSVNKAIKAGALPLKAVPRPKRAAVLEKVISDHQTY